MEFDGQLSQESHKHTHARTHTQTHGYDVQSRRMNRLHIYLQFKEIRFTFAPRRSQWFPFLPLLNIHFVPNSQKNKTKKIPKTKGLNWNALIERKHDETNKTAEKNVLLAQLISIELHFQSLAGQINF